MVIKEDCKDCVWCANKGNGKYFCVVDRAPLQADTGGKIKPPASCHYSADWRGRE